MPSRACLDHIHAGLDPCFRLRPALCSFMVRRCWLRDGESEEALVEKGSASLLHPAYARRTTSVGVGELGGGASAGADMEAAGACPSDRAGRAKCAGCGAAPGEAAAEQLDGPALGWAGRRGSAAREKAAAAPRTRAGRRGRPDAAQEKEESRGYSRAFVKDKKKQISFHPLDRQWTLDIWSPVKR